jgi:hypothetical protein
MHMPRAFAAAPCTSKAQAGSRASWLRGCAPAERTCAAQRARGAALARGPVGVWHPAGLGRAGHVAAAGGEGGAGRAADGLVGVHAIA